MAGEFLLLSWFGQQKLGFDADAYEDLTNAVEQKNEKAEVAINELFTSNNQKTGKFFNMFRSPSFKSNNYKGLKLKAIETTEESSVLHFTDGRAGGG